MKTCILSTSRFSLSLNSAIAAMPALLALSPGSVSAADGTWDGGAAGTATAWATLANWAGDAAFPGASGSSANGDIANVKAGTGTTLQMNMTTFGGNFSLGALDFERTTAATWNNNVATAGILRLNGATVGGVANTLVRQGATGGNLTIADGTGTMGLALGNTNGIFEVGSGRTLTITSIISHVTSGNGFTKTGAGTLSLGGANTYNGATIISAGALVLTNVNALQNSSGLTLGGASPATLTFGGDTTGVIIPGAITAANSGVNSTISFGRNTANAGLLTLSGGITSGAGNVIFTTPGTNGTNGGQSQTIVLGSAGGYSGNTTITSGGNQFTNIIRAGVANALPATTVLTFTGVTGAGSGRTSTYDLNGFNQELAGLQNTSAADRFQRVTSATAATLTINNSSNYTFGNATAGADPGNAQITGAISLTKSGAGTFTLLGTQVYTGATTINAGTLVVNGSITASNVSVSGTGTLKGSGSISGMVTIDTGGTLASGNSIESLGVGSLSFASGSTYAYELQTDLYAGTPSAAGDLTYASGMLDIAAGANLNFTELASSTVLADGSKITLISYFGGWTGTELFTFNAATLNDGDIITLGANDWQFKYNDSTGGPNFSSDQTGATNFVTMTVVPEPSVTLLGGLGLLAVLRRRR